MPSRISYIFIFFWRYPFRNMIRISYRSFLWDFSWKSSKHCWRNSSRNLFRRFFNNSYKDFFKKCNFSRHFCTEIRRFFIESCSRVFNWVFPQKFKNKNTGAIHRFNQLFLQKTLQNLFIEIFQEMFIEILQYMAEDSAVLPGIASMNPKRNIYKCLQ